LKCLTIDGSFVAVGDADFDDAIMSLNKFARSSSFSQLSSNGSALVILSFGNAVTAATVPKVIAATLNTIANVSRTILSEYYHVICWMVRLSFHSIIHSPLQSLLGVLLFVEGDYCHNIGGCARQEMKEEVVDGGETVGGKWQLAKWRQISKSEKVSSEN